MSYLKGKTEFYGMEFTLKDGSKQLIIPCSEVKEDIEKELNPKYYHPKSYDELKEGTECELLPINESLGWQKGILRYRKGYTDPFNSMSIFNLSPFWYIMVKFPDTYGPITLMLKDLNHIKIPNNA